MTIANGQAKDQSSRFERRNPQFEIRNPKSEILKTMISQTLQDIRYGLRMLAKNPGVSLVAVITLALGIGANSAIFSAVSAFVFRPLPVSEPDQLVRLMEVKQDRTSDELSYPDYRDYRDQSTLFAGLAVEEMAQVAFGTETENDVIWGQVVSGNYFDVLRVKPVIGRAFAPEEDRTPGSHPVVVFSHSFWQRRLGADQNIVGKTVHLNGRSYNVIGIAPEYFKGTEFSLSLDFWVPIMMMEDLGRSPQLLTSRDSHSLNVLGRLKPDVSQAQASSELAAIAQRLNQSYPNERAANTSARVLNEIEGRFDDAAPVIRSGAAIAMAIVGLVLLIACANVANLMLARASARRKEIGVRLALGASRARLIRQLLTESLMLSILGGVLGLLLAFWVTHLMQAFAPSLPYNFVDDIFAVDYRTLIFTMVISLMTGLIFGLAPAWQSSNTSVFPVLKEDSAPALRGIGRRITLRNSLVVAQMALSLLVLICGGLFIKSFRNAQSMDPGFVTSGVMLASINPQFVGYTDEQTKNFFKQIVERAATLPGVKSASLTRLMPLGDSSNSHGPILKEGETLARGSEGLNVRNSTVSPGYFKTLEIPIIDGRDFDERDEQGKQRVVIVNQKMAEVIWPGESAIGKRLFIGTDSREPIEVIGVVKTGKYQSIAEEPRPFYYYPMAQRRPGRMTLLLRTDQDPRSLVGGLRREVESLDRRMPLFDVKTMTQHMSYAFWGPKMAATLSLAFGLVALVLSAVGLYSVMAYVVSQRTREVGIRIALGAQRGDVLKLIASQGMRLALVGLAIGLALSLVLSRVLSTMLIGISAYDVTPFVVVPLLLAIVALIACLVPARRATKVDPLVALRYE